MNRGIDQQTCRQTDKQINRKKGDKNTSRLDKYKDIKKDRQIKRQTNK